MRKNRNGKMLSTVRAISLILLAFILSQCNNSGVLSEQEYAVIQDDFVDLKESNKLWCYYYWIDDDISKEGVTKDMEAMKEFGIGAVLIGNINPNEVDGPVPLFSDKWWEIIVHAVNEGHRLGIDVGNFNSPGWSQSGGPWVSYEKAMRHLVYSEISVSGTQEVSVNLVKPADEFQDTYVLAFQKIQAEKNRLTNSNSSVICSPAIRNPEKLFDENPATSALFTISNDAEYTINISSNNLIKARSLLLYPTELVFKCDCELFAKIDEDYSLISSFPFDRSNPSVAVGPVVGGPVAISLPETSASSFRLVCKNMVSNVKESGFSDILITESQVLEKYIEKTLGKMHPTPFPEFDSYLWDQQDELGNKNLIISDVIDLSDKMNENGLLTWQVPDGEWTVLRMGMTPTGTKNSPAAPQGKGYEIDKASEELVRFHFEQYIAEIQKRVPEESRSAFKYVIADSYEMGSQNWTDGFEERFTEKYGYNPVKYLPVMSGRIVGSVEESERFLWDLRRAVADDIAYQYVGGLRKISNENNMQLWLENYGHWGYPGEFLMYGGQTNLLSGEFWNEGSLGNVECKSASSAAHIYGKPITSAEAFTAASHSYKRHPALLKKRGDWSMTEGINHFVLHLYIHQPDDERIPGVNAWFSTEFNRHNTWFKQGKTWADYMRRSQYLLQQGKYAADVCYFIGEDAPKMTGTRDPELPDGYSYDYINAEVILTRLAVENGKFVLPDGMTYSVMVLPKLETMRPKVLAKIEELVKQGGVVLGSAPLRSPSLQNYPENDEEVHQIATRMWTNNYVDGKLAQAYGKGFVFDGMGLQEVLDNVEIEKDFDLLEDVPVLWTHRTLPGMDIYFVTNQGDDELDIKPSFRVVGLSPQLWDAVSDDIRLLNDYTVENGRTIVPLTLKAQESYFIVFTNQINEKTGLGYIENFPDAESILTIDGDWTIDFLNKDIGPKEPLHVTNLTDWTHSDNEQIKYYSGTAIYSTAFTMEDVPESGDIFLNLGQVGVMAHAKLNGKDLGGTWIAPFLLHTNDYLKQGKNLLEIEVVNLWRNRMVLDESLPQDQKYTWTSVEDVEAGEELSASGLLGPVSIEIIK